MKVQRTATLLLTLLTMQAFAMDGKRPTGHLPKQLMDLHKDTDSGLPLPPPGPSLPAEAPEKFTTETVFRQIEEVKKDIEINDVGDERKSLKQNGFQKIRLPGRFTEKLIQLHEEKGTSMENNEAFVNELASIVGRLPFEGLLYKTEEEDEDGAALVRFYCYGGYLYDMPLLDGRGISLGGALRTAAHPGEQDALIRATEDGRKTQGAAYQVHIDRNIDSPTLFPATFNDYLQHVYKEELREKRIHLTNIWVPLKNYSARPLAFADLQSTRDPLSSFDKPVSWDYFGTKAIEVLFPRHDECQKWFYYKDLKEGEEAIIFDTLRTPHVAVKNPNHTGPEERHSIEIRCLSFTVRRKVLMNEEEPTEQLMKTFDVLQKMARYRYNKPSKLPETVLAELRAAYRLQAQAFENRYPGLVQKEMEYPYPTEHELAVFDQRLRAKRDVRMRQDLRLRRDEQRWLMERKELLAMSNEYQKRMILNIEQQHEDLEDDIDNSLVCASAKTRQDSDRARRLHPDDSERSVQTLTHQTEVSLEEEQKVLLLSFKKSLEEQLTSLKLSMDRQKQIEEDSVASFNQHKDQCLKLLEAANILNDGARTVGVAQATLKPQQLELMKQMTEELLERYRAFQRKTEDQGEDNINEGRE